MEMEEAFEPRGSYDADANVVPSGEKASHRDLSSYGSPLRRYFALAYNIIRAYATCDSYLNRRPPAIRNPDFSSSTQKSRENMERKSFIPCHAAWKILSTCSTICEQMNAPDATDIPAQYTQALDELLFSYDEGAVFQQVLTKQTLQFQKRFLQQALLFGNALCLSES